MSELDDVKAQLQTTHQQVAEVAALLGPNVVPDAWGLYEAAKRTINALKEAEAAAEHERKSRFAEVAGLSAACVRLEADLAREREEKRELLRIERIAGATLHAIMQNADDPYAKDVAERAYNQCWPPDAALSRPGNEGAHDFCALHGTVPASHRCASRPVNPEPKTPEIARAGKACACIPCNYCDLDVQGADCTCFDEAYTCKQHREAKPEEGKQCKTCGHVQEDWR
jgi:hypothetical protein